MVAQFLVPLIFTAVALVVAQTLPGKHKIPELPLALSRYGPTSVPIALDSNAGPLVIALAEAYAAQLATQSATPVANLTDFSEYVLNNAMREGGAFNEHCVVGAAFSGRTSKFAEITGYFNNQGYHTAATALMLVDNALYRL
ncbi:hypothetical protein KOW79_001742 [Hemibagrus wyckioides]|uniref:Uncharacterized protein n=1 Tax=Hemibagrus wyckioides TaxID=337641 RepID=A0A9D3P6W8_9TELE|nr:hypothetical protein KOW79_001742 [Hemibagrus wyckioides]